MANQKKDFEKFYQTHFDKVYRFVFFRCGNRELAEDLVSEIFMKALDHFEAYDEKRGRSAWIITIAKNHLANYWRDRKETISLDSGPPNEEEGEMGDDSQWLKSSLAVFNRQAETNMVYEVLAKLPPEEAEIVTLHYLIGYNYAEIAAMKNSTQGAIKVAAHRIIKKLQTLI